MSTPQSADQQPAFAGGLGPSAEEVRVLGCLLEKQSTTPDAYPLSLNALCLACNQATNRDPVVDYAAGTVRDALHRLERRGYARLASGAGSRAAKYRHRLDETLPLDGGERALLCVLMLRGEQTPGELKQRAERMHSFADLGAVHDALERLIERRLAVGLERRPGQKEERYRQLLGQERNGGSGSGAAPEAPGGRALERVEADELLARIERLERQLAELQKARRGDVAQDAPRDRMGERS